MRLSPILACAVAACATPTSDTDGPGAPADLAMAHADADAHDLAGTHDLAATHDSAVPDSAPPPDLARPIDLAGADMAPTVIHPSRPHWRLTFADDFRGKPGGPDDAYCYDQLAPQCAIWAGAATNDCSLDDVNGDIFPPTRPNLVAALTLADPKGNYAAMSDAMIKTAYGQLVAARWKYVNKCNWSSYEMLNWMATDYQGHWSSRFDPTLVTVDPTGKGYLELSAADAPPAADCVFGGQSFGGPNCQVHAFAAGVLSTSIKYWVDANPAFPGVYYAQINNACPSGGAKSGPNCALYSFAPYQVDPSVTYWVDSDPRWPGVYYADTTIACRDNIDYPSGGVHFRPLTCGVLNGGVESMLTPNRGWTDPSTQMTRERGTTQRQGRFEVKLRIPKGQGAFPAAWLMPDHGGWPFDGGEIDILEARDAANEIYQTYHHGRCVDPKTGQKIAATDPGACASAGGVPVHLSHGYTVAQRSTDEFNTRDHLFAVEWDDSGLRYYVNGVLTGGIGVGMAATADPSTTGTPASFDAANLPVNAFYWILNHTTWVAPSAQSTWASQTLRIDYVKSYARCTLSNEYCPCGGGFVENTGCVLNGAPLSCPAGTPAPTVTGGIYASSCAPATGACVNGGKPSGSQCVVYTFAPGTLHAGVQYWVDADPRWPGVYYHLVNGACPYGGSGTANCELLGLPADLLETGVAYTVDNTAAQIVYAPDFAP